MEENAIFQEKQPKLWLAILSAIGMGLLGCLLWGLLYYVGYIAWAAAFAIVFGAAWAYKKFNLKLDKKGYFIISAIAIVEVILTMFVTLNIACMIEFAKESVSVSFFECFKLMFEVIGADSGFKGAVIADAILSLVFIGVGLVSFFLIDRRNSKSQKDDVAKPLNLDQNSSDIEKPLNLNNAGDKTNQDDKKE